HLQSWEAVLHEYAIAPIQQFAYTKGKNASDMAMVIDAMDLLWGGEADGFAIVSSDSDFTPLAMRLRQSGKTVLGFGQKKTPEPFVNACSRFFQIEQLASTVSDDEDETEGTETTRPTKRVPGAKLRQDAKLVSMLRAAVDSASDDDGWATL